MADEENKTVKVGCRQGNGLVLRVSDWFDSVEIPGTKQLREIGTVNLAGPIASHGESAGFPKTETVSDVDAHLFDKWWAANKESDLVTSGLVYRVEDEEKARAEEAKKAEQVAEDAEPKADAPKDEPKLSDKSVEDKTTEVKKVADVRPLTNETRPFSPTFDSKDEPKKV